MAPVSRWAQSARFPVTKTIKEYISCGHRRQSLQSNIVSESLCTDIFQRLAPYLNRNKPVDILDLWPGAGIWSSQINRLIRPRHHVLVEPDMAAYGQLLKQLARDDPSYKFLSIDIYKINKWEEIFQKYFPEQVAQYIHNRPQRALLPRNDTLLVLANPPPVTSKKDHFTPARWWSAIMENCLKQQGLHMYGSVRILATFPAPEAQAILPRSVGERKRPAILTEATALHALEVASTYDYEVWPTIKGWKAMTDGIKRVADRAADASVVTPPGREGPPLLLAPESPRYGKGRQSYPYQPRARTEIHDRLLEDLEETSLAPNDKSDTAKDAAKRARSAVAALNSDNKTAYIREYVVNKSLAIDERMRALSRAAANLSMSPEELQVIDKQITTMYTALADEISAYHYKFTRSYERIVDDGRVAAISNNFDNSTLLWDRRPFEPLRIDAEELYPRASRSLIYFEPDENSIAMQKLSEIPAEKRLELLELFDMVTLIFGTRNHLSMAELSCAIFPGRCTNDLVRSIPSLAPLAMKRLKPGCGPVPLKDPTADPNHCFQENLDYDLSQTHVRLVPVSTIWDVLLEYQRNSLDLSVLQFSRMLGGTLTTFRSGETIMHKKRLH